MKTVLITGAAKRGGAAIARRIHARGYRVILQYRASSEAEALTLFAELNAIRQGSCLVWKENLNGSISSPPEVGTISGIVANASEYVPTTIAGSAMRLCVDLDTHLLGHLAIVRHCEKALIRNNGSIVAVTDIHVERPAAGFLSYMTAKGALAAAMRALAADLAPHVRVNCVAPGPLQWPSNESISDSAQEAVVRSTPLKRIGTFEELATAVEFMLFDATFTTGATLNVDGGRSNYLEV